MSAIDPGTAQVMRLSSELMDSRETIISQQETIVALCAVLKAQERSLHLLTYLVGELLTQGSR